MGKDVALADLPIVTIRTPMDVHVGGSGAVFGEVGPSASLDLGNSGCGDWRVADVHGALAVALSGSGDVHAGATGESQVRISGSGDVFLGPVNGALETRTSGSGDIRAASVRGPISTAIAGSGNVVVDGGDASQVGCEDRGVWGLQVQGNRRRGFGVYRGLGRCRHRARHRPGVQTHRRIGRCKYRSLKPYHNA